MIEPRAVRDLDNAPSRESRPVQELSYRIRFPFGMSGREVLERWSEEPD